MTEVIWEDPPARQGARNHKLTAFIEELKAHPKEWARWPDRMSYGWGSGVVARYPGLESAARNLERSEGRKSYTCDVYFRWIGEA